MFVLRVIALALTYAGAGWLGTLIAIPPGYATAVFPAAGVALAVLIHGGASYAPGVWLGSFLLSLYVSSELGGGGWSDIFLATGIGFGAAVQALGARFLIARTVKDIHHLDSASDIWRFLIFGGPIASVISTSIGVSALLACGKILTSDFGYTVFTWWTGDTIGTIIFTPLVLAVLQAQTPLWKKRLTSVAAPTLLVFSAAVFVYTEVNSWESQRVRMEFRQYAEHLTTPLRDTLQSYLLVVDAVARHLENSPEPNYASFSSFVERYPKEFPGIKALEWAPLVSLENREKVEAKLRAEGFPNFVITEMVTRGQVFPEKNRPDYLPLLYVVPYDGNELAMGLDVLSIPNRQGIMDKARDTQSALATAPVILVQSRSDEAGFTINEPVYSLGSVNTASERRAKLRGFVVAAFNGAAIAEHVFKDVSPQDISITIDDISDTPLKHPQLFNNGGIGAPDTNLMSHSELVQLAGRSWGVRYGATASYIAHHRSLQSWGVLVGGLLFVSLLQAYLLVVSGQKSRIETLVEDRTKELLSEIAQRRDAESQLELAASVYHTTEEGIIITDADGIILSANPAFADITGYSVQEVIGKTPRLLKSALHDEAFYKNLWSILLSTGRWQGEIWNRRKSGETFLEKQTISMVTDDQGKPLRYVSVFNDITELRRKDERIRHLAFHDALTGLPNRALTLERLDHAIDLHSRGRQAMAVIFLDLDHFKDINDSLGHAIGDDLLKTISSRILSVLRQTDTVSRLGGDEFVILLENPSDANEVAAICDRILALINIPMDIQGNVPQISGSIGIAMFPSDGDTSGILMKNADTAMYAAKAAGRNTLRFFDSQMTEKAEKRLKLVADLKDALERKQFELYFQPQINLVTGLPCGAEALIRWRHPERGLISPLDFIPVAEETNMIIPIGEWVIRETCHYLASLRSKGIFDLLISINLSAPQLMDQGVTNLLKSLMAQYEIPGRQIEFELTESSVMSDPEHVAELFRVMQQLDVTIAIDDFGTGYSSLSYLRKLPIDTLKIDRAFVMDLEHDQEDVEIIRTIIALGKALHLSTVAEGVETEGQAAFLREEGCEMAQGYLYSRPLNAQDFEQWILSHSHGAINRVRAIT